MSGLESIKSRQSQASKASHRSRSRLGVGFTAGLDEQNFDRDTELELQRTKSHRNAELGKEDDPNLVEFCGPDDPGNPQNWPLWKKWTITGALGMMCFVATFSSSVFASAITETSELFNVSTEVMTLGVSLNVLGYAVGPILWGPFSELYGRKMPLFIGYAIFAIFQIPVAVAQNIETVMICRFLGGCAACAPLVIVGASLADFWDPVDRGVAMGVFASSIFVGPALGPSIGGFMVLNPNMGWRWTAWLTLVMAAFLGLLGFFLVPESYAPVILQGRAKRIRFETKNWAIHAKADEQQVDLREIVTKYLTRPFLMLLSEPILVAMTVYMSLLYGIIYLFFEVFPIIYEEQRGWNAGVGGLPFLSLLIGILLGCSIMIWHVKTRFARKLAKEGRVVPEERLLPTILGGVLLPAGLFWFAWTNGVASPWPQLIALVPIGMGFILIFVQGLTYIIDCYLMFAASAIAANTVARSMVGAGFPMFATAMFDNLGVPWATSLLGFLTLAMLPAPILFYLYGGKLRKISKFSLY
ncbi:MFS general substrate transporter [Teratosphaeria nubilosa]|uniref:Cercosporin MFS transporter CTB4 n=1 Tax=Teratosphaeria nubilosa TaxID=161662 RepID=A0A6G1KXZ6_9PEZI|nr:MFS general substrate transporter [Teratosphaeria nubilosa]